MKKFLSQLGFTMIELLVVISVIGVLAVAVLSSINPIEQINKGRDTRTRSDAAQLINAVDRFFATQEEYPWNDDAYACGVLPAEGGSTGGAGTCGAPAFTITDADPATEFPTTTHVTICTPIAAAEGAIGVGMCQLDAAGGLWMDGLTATNEVKPGFIGRIKAQTTYAIYVMKPQGGNQGMTACFRPSSLSFQKEAVDACSDAGTRDAWGDEIAAAACPGDWDGTAYTATGDQDELICLP